MHSWMLSSLATSSSRASTGKACGNQFARCTQTFGGISRAEDCANAELRELPTDLEANSAVAARDERDLVLGHFSLPIMEEAAKSLK
jgi:hypothetical protein